MIYDENSIYYPATLLAFQPRPLILTPLPSGFERKSKCATNVTTLPAKENDTRKHIRTLPPYHTEDICTREMTSKCQQCNRSPVKRHPPKGITGEHT